MNNERTEEDLAKKLDEIDQKIEETHGKSLYGPFYNPPKPLGEQDPKYLGLIEKIQIVQEQQQMDMLDIRSRVVLMEKRMARALSLSSPDFIVPVCALIGGFGLIIAGILTNVIFYVAGGTACIVPATLHLLALNIRK